MGGGQAIQTANYIINRTISTNPILHVIWQAAFPGIDESVWMQCLGSHPKGNKEKTETKNFWRMKKGSKAYRFLDGNINVVISRTANFCEHENWDKVHANSEVFIPINNGEKSQGIEVAPKEKAERSSGSSNSELDDGECNETESKPVIKEEPGVLRRSERSNKGVPPSRFDVGEIRVCHVFYEPKNIRRYCFCLRQRK